ncbi:MAG: 4Fe-4S dicluster domain-containing protein, partial [Victivallales bacterium]
WICPLSFIGDMADRIRRIFNMPHLKPSDPVKLGYIFSGAGLAALGLTLAKCYPHIDENGKFMGCKIPLYPFCKICPGQQVCPVMSAGLSQYPPLPGWEWVFGTYRIGVVLMLAFFIATFAIGRRLWCYFCPMGMVSGIFNRGGMMVLRKETLKCTRCGVCNEVCPMHIDYVRSEMKATDVSTYSCLLCLKCVQKCPQDSCLSLEFAGRKITESRFK